MNAQAALLEQWRPALAFLLGVKGRYSASRIHEVHFPRLFPVACEKCDCSCSESAGQQGAAQALGAVLGIGILKAYRNPSQATSLRGQREGYGPLEHLTKSLTFLHMVTSCGHQIRDSAYGVIAQVLELAMRAPERLPALHARLDAIDNAEMHRLAMAAVQGQGRANVLDDLLEPSEVAK